MQRVAKHSLVVGSPWRLSKGERDSLLTYTALHGSLVASHGEDAPTRGHCSMGDQLKESKAEHRRLHYLRPRFEKPLCAGLKPTD